MKALPGVEVYTLLSVLALMPPVAAPAPNALIGLLEPAVEPYEPNDAGENEAGEK